MYLNHDEIVSLCFSGEMLDWDDACVNAASLDVRLGDTVLFERAPGRMVNYGKRERLDMMEVKLDAGGIVIKPGDFFLAHTMERCNFHDSTAALFRIKSSMGRIGLEHLDAGWVDPGFHGALTLEFVNVTKHHEILIRPGDDIDLGFDGLETLSPAALAPLFARTPALHKGDCGRAVIFCGSRGMVGAAAFCANACIRAGAGLTTLLCRESLLPMLQVLAPGATCVPLPETNGLLTPQAARITRETLDKADAACIGCGCGLTPDVTMLLRVFAEADCPIVWDADALTLLATHDGILPLKEEDIITPHPGEAARLLEQHVEFILDEPLDALSRLHDLCGCCVLLKGARTLVSDGDATYISLYGTPALAKGGSGDVLSGILTALLCQRNRLSTSLSTSALAAYGVLIHALAGLRAEKRFGANCSTPQALIDAIRLDDKEL